LVPLSLGKRVLAEEREKRLNTAEEKKAGVRDRFRRATIKVSNIDN
jgi:hypothetical protein